MRKAIGWICDHALTIALGWFGVVAVGYAVVAEIWISDWSNWDRLLGLAKSALPLAGLGLALVTAAETIDRLSPQARLNLHWLHPPDVSKTTKVPILELENRSSVEARKVELAVLISVHQRWPVDLRWWRDARPHREERNRVLEHFNSELFNHVELWPRADEDPVWERPERSAIYPVRNVWLLDHPLAPGQRLEFEPRFEKSLRSQIVKADKSIDGITFVVTTSTGRRTVFRDTRLVSVIRARGLY